MRASWGPKDDPLVPRNYKVPSYGVDTDIINTQSSISGTEKLLKKTMHADFGLKDGVPRNYAVADFGQDHDIVTSLNNSKAWTPTKGPDGKYIVPPGAIEFKL